MYLFYIDESGEIGYNSGTKYFVYNAFGIHEADWKNINNQVNNLKTQVFKSNKAPILEIKSNWLRNPHERNRREYLKNLSENELKQLSYGLYDIILHNNCVLLSSVINKDSLLKHYGINKPDVNLFALKYLLERISIYMNKNHPAEQAIIIMDKCSDHIEKMLNQTHTLQQAEGYTWQNNKNIIENLLFVDSQYNNFIQLTDLCAYSINRAFKDDNPEYEFFRLLF